VNVRKEGDWNTKVSMFEQRDEHVDVLSIALRVKSIAFSILSNVPHRNTTLPIGWTESMGLD
jgi:hypothetical protein